ncbi:MAG: dihydroorotase [Gammaproteobacteria bacterium]|nr:dihydroorotase [Gammaproteobacteria bacterium]
MLSGARENLLGRFHAARRRLRRGLCQCELEAQNGEFAGTAGVSQYNRSAGFVPAYCNHADGQVVASRFADGTPAPIHVLEGVPEHWVEHRDADSGLIRLKPTVEAGFLRDGRFFSREAARAAVEQEQVVADG